MLAHRLKQARLRAGLSQEKLGKLAGIDPMSASARMNQYERGKHSPDYQLMCRVAEILNMPVSWFYTEDEELALSLNPEWLPGQRAPIQMYMGAMRKMHEELIKQIRKNQS